MAEKHPQLSAEMTELFFPHTYECIIFFIAFLWTEAKSVDDFRRLFDVSSECTSPSPPLPPYFLAVSLRAILHKTENLFIGYFHGFRFAEDHEDAQTRRSW